MKGYALNSLLIVGLLGILSYVIYHKKMGDISFGLGSDEGSKRSIAFYYADHASMRHEVSTIVWEGSVEHNLKNCVNTWLALIYREHITKTLIEVLSCSLSKSKTEMYISLSSSFFDVNDSIYYKWTILRSLFKTIHEQFPLLKKIFFFEKQKCMHDNHIDFSQGFFIDAA